MSIADVRKDFEGSLQKMDRLLAAMKNQRDTIKRDFERKLEQLRFGKFDPELFDKFLEQPYIIMPTRRPEQWYVIVPKWIDLQIGYLERATPSYNMFIVSRYVKWFTDIPEALQEKLRFREPKPFKIYDGMLFTGKQLQEEAWSRYKPFLVRREGPEKIRIKKGWEFKLIAQMIDDGTLPFLPKPVEPEDLRTYEGIKLRPYQEKAWRTFLESGATGIFWAFGSGKSFFGVYALGCIKGKKLVVVPSLTLKEQWKERITKYLPSHEAEIQVETYHAFKKLTGQQFSLIEFDECQHLPANTFIRLATLKTKYRMGFSGSPYREDGRENYIIALTGFPIGIAWEELLERKYVKEPKFRVYILKDYHEKLRKLDELVRIPLKTIIFCDWIRLGKQIAKKFEIPFISGQTKGEDRLNLIRDSQTCVVSRVGDEGLSFPDIERGIEIAFLYGSRMQESQRFGRLMHSEKEQPEHIILMTEKEFTKYQKRLLAIHERGFRVEYIR